MQKSLDDDKAQDMVVIDLAGKSSLADYLVIVTGTSQRHVCAMAERLQEKIKEAGVRNPSLEGVPQGDWALLDAGDVIVHLFRAEVREFYGLEKMWATLPDAKEKPVRKTVRKPKAGAAEEAPGATA
ncbi:MAG: ribosome silencing factor [Magnetospirillum sp. WYHS-4]